MQLITFFSYACSLHISSVTIAVLKLERLELKKIAKDQLQKFICLPGLPDSDIGLRPDRAGEESGDRFFSAVSTEDKAATAAAL